MKNPHTRLRRKRNLQRRRRNLRRLNNRYPQKWADAATAIAGLKGLFAGLPAAQVAAAFSHAMKDLAVALQGQTIRMQVKSQRGYGKSWGPSQSQHAQLYGGWSQHAGWNVSWEKEPSVDVETVWAEHGLHRPSSSPDIVGSVVGYRVWDLDYERPPTFNPFARKSGKEETVDPQLRLEPMARGPAWHPGTNVFKCYRDDAGFFEGVSETHDVPVPWCGCGFWGMYDPTDIPWDPVVTATYYSPLGKYLPLGRIWGRIEAWGVVVEATKGFRAEKARVVELYYPIWADQGTRESRTEASEKLEELAARFEVPITDYRE